MFDCVQYPAAGTSHRRGRVFQSDTTAGAHREPMRARGRNRSDRPGVATGQQLLQVRRRVLGGLRRLLPGKIVISRPLDATEHAGDGGIEILTPESRQRERLGRVLALSIVDDQA